MFFLSFSLSKTFLFQQTNKQQQQQQQKTTTLYLSCSVHGQAKGSRCRLGAGKPHECLPVISAPFSYQILLGGTRGSWKCWRNIVTAWCFIPKHQVELVEVTMNKKVLSSANYVRERLQKRHPWVPFLFCLETRLERFLRWSPCFFDHWTSPPCCSGPLTGSTPPGLSGDILTAAWNATERVPWLLLVGGM